MMLCLLFAAVYEQCDAEVHIGDWLMRGSSTMCRHGYRGDANGVVLTTNGSDCNVVCRDVTVLYGMSMLSVKFGRRAYPSKE